MDGWYCPFVFRSIPERRCAAGVYDTASELLMHVENDLGGHRGKRSARPLGCWYNGCDYWTDGGITTWIAHVAPRRVNDLHYQDWTTLRDGRQPPGQHYLQEEAQAHARHARQVEVMDVQVYDQEQRPRATELFTTAMTEVTQHVTDFHGKLLYVHGVPGTISEKIKQDAISMALIMHKSVMNVLSVHFADINMTDQLTETIMNSDAMKRHCVSTPGMLHDYQMKIGFCEPYELDLSKIAPHKNWKAARGTKGGYGVGGTTYCYVDVIQQLRAVLAVPGVIDLVLKQKCSQVDGRLESYLDSKNCKKHVLFSADLPNTCLSIILYGDELDPCNALAAKHDKKFFAVYWQLASMGVRWLSSMFNMNLALVCRYDLVCFYGSELVLKPVIDSFKRLATAGLSLTVAGQQYHFLGAVQYVVADSLTAHNIFLGLSAGFSRGHCCRACILKADDLSSPAADIPDDAENLPENREKRTHENHFIWHARRQHGCKKDFGLRGLPHVEFPSCVVFDVMHDLELELIGLVLMNVLIGLDVDNELKYPKAMEYINTFVYGKADISDRPPFLPKELLAKNSKGKYKYHIRGTASQRRLLFHVFGYALGPYVTHKSNKWWQLYLLMSKIYSITCSQIVDETILTDFSNLVEELALKWRAYGVSKNPCKKHWLISHYKTQFLEYGPLAHQVSAPFEHNHQALKKEVKQGRNTRNIALSVTYKYQHHRCRTLQNGLPASIVFINVERVVSMQVIGNDLRLAIYEEGETVEVVSISSHITYNGTHVTACCLNPIFPTRRQVRDKEQPFMIVRECVIVGGDPYAWGIKVITKYDKNYDAWRVPNYTAMESCLVSCDEFVPRQTVSCYSVRRRDDPERLGKAYVKCRYRPAARVD